MRDPSCAVGVAAAEVPPHECLARDRNGIEGEREEGPELEGDLVARGTTSEMRAARAVVASSAASREPVRITSWLPTTAAARMPAGRGRGLAPVGPARRATSTRNTIAAPSWAATVAHADPATPRCRP